MCSNFAPSPLKLFWVSCGPLPLPQQIRACNLESVDAPAVNATSRSAALYHRTRCFWVTEILYHAGHVVEICNCSTRSLSDLGRSR
ncbi:unnamed protein product [Chondrus crispus]|uniref:Uncharacterized protein n=1 Tax=Chondrus crispus TaxID=2769 RepID=R7Q3Z7_CHOCR|nr:unnamed protein product [Chondrus crispus]CDF32588.1 unnamed protein product [Chondrus crispus]|eukprot:XP_005712359.1 unnamed protein product [Chondrus crispus]